MKMLLKKKQKTGASDNGRKNICASMRGSI